MQAISCQRARAAAFRSCSRKAVVHVRASTEQANTAAPRLQKFLTDCSTLGRCRMIVVGDSILETVVDLRDTGVKLTDIPNKGTLATVSNADKTFECHLYVDKIRQIKLAKSKAKAGDWMLYAARFMGDENKMLLTCLLHGQQGSYEAAAVEAWEKLHATYGETVDLA